MLIHLFLLIFSCNEPNLTEEFILVQNDTIAPSSQYNKLVVSSEIMSIINNYENTSIDIVLLSLLKKVCSTFGDENQ